MSQRTKVVGTRSFIVWLLIIIVVVMIAALVVGGLVVYPRLQDQRAEQARLAQAEQHYQAGVAFQNVSDWGAAEAEFKQVITLDATYKDVQTQLAEVKVKLLEAQYQRALGLVNLGQWVEAQLALQAVFALDPNYKDVQAQLAVVNAEIAKLKPTATPTPLVTPTPQSVPHAIIADTVSDGSITTEKIADGAVTAAKLDSNWRTDITRGFTPAVYSDHTSRLVSEGLHRWDSSGYSKVNIAFKVPDDYVSGDLTVRETFWEHDTSAGTVAKMLRVITQYRRSDGASTHISSEAADYYSVKAHLMGEPVAWQIRTPQLVGVRHAAPPTSWRLHLPPKLVCTHQITVDKVLHFWKPVPHFYHSRGQF